MADFGRDPRNNDSWRARRNLNTTRRSMLRLRLLQQNFDIFTASGRYSNKTQTFLENFNVLRLQAAITPQRLLIAGNSRPK